MINIIACISGTGTNFEAIHNACKAGNIDGKVVAVVSDNPDAKGLKFGFNGQK